MEKKQRILMTIFLSLLTGMTVWFLGLTVEKKDENVVYISSPQELQEFARNVNAGNSYENMHVILTCDLDLSAISNFTPIGVWRGDAYFRGTFDGAGHTIRNLTILGEGEDANLGLFGTLEGTICNLTVDSCLIRGNACGAFVSTAGENASIINCAVRNADIDAIYTDILGGQYYGIVENCVIDGQGDVTGLNSNLRNLWREYDMLPMNKWVIGEDGVILSEERASLPERIYLVIDGFRDTQFLPLYLEEENEDIFCIPAFEGIRDAEVVMEFPDGSVSEEPITLPGTGELVLKNDEETFAISFVVSENTPTLFIETGKDWGFEYLCQSQSNQLPGNIRVLDENGELQYNGRAERIRGRGNDSWGQLKSSFAFKLAAGGNILNMGTDEDYILLPGYRDASLLTYQVIWDLCKEMKWEHALSGEMVQLYVDGRYEGLYFLSEKVEAGPDRIDIVENGNPTSGYVFEYDILDYEAMDVRVQTEQGSSYTYVSPNHPTAEQQEYCLNLWNEYEEALYSEDGYNELGKHFTEYIDIESMAAQWIFYELCAEPSIASSVYFYKNADGTEDDKIHAFAPWDVEHSFVNRELVEGSRMQETKIQFENGFWLKLCAHDEFVEEVRRQWEERFLPALEKLVVEADVADSDGVSSLTHYVNQLEKASDVNELLCGPKHDVAMKAEQIREWLEVRIPYLNVNLYRDEFFEE